ncbi:hypothetical protein SISNIDRAFT_449236 [Sistotremastrum niveocremeum HHB9708]|uniref:Glucosidase 2 subunit beta n=1 Tax=Sistotremastrum niveocremeum HHB9708 TaxID=1314777 RepID=A0A164ZFE2_9AGAM|nr:hypothetical protein SISNIDRAFT_449236 [Sistotremastrum niveocremeum HHB9708]
MLPLPLLLTLALPVRAEPPHVFGVRPALAPLYTPICSKTPPTWKCLDGSLEIPFSAVNDDYCDCPDGSDEPGTSACPNTTFYCRNEGHLGAVIPSSRVRDGLCEPECCDGSDEPEGLCPNKCEETGREYREQVEAERKLRKTGSKIRSTYIAHAQKEKKRLEKELVSIEAEIAERQAEVDKLKAHKEKTESISAATMELKKQSPLYFSLITHSKALKSFQRVHKKLKERERLLGDILTGLRDGYNPNYQDMAVLEAVRGWEAAEGLPPKGSEDDDVVVNSPAEEEELEEGAWTEGQLEWQLNDLINQDYLDLLLQHETYLESLEKPSLLHDLSSYIPDSIRPQYESVRDTLISTLQSVGLIKGGSNEVTEEANRARIAFEDAEKRLRESSENKEDTEQELGRLFSAEGFGKSGEWKKLQDVCLEKDTGEYIYEVCLFGSAKQKAKTGSHSNLGDFSHWNTQFSTDDPQYYSKQYYTGGTRCWNGPERSLTLHLSCGTENVLHSVSEPEKCEYHIVGQTPALCLPLEIEENPKVEL